MQIEQSLRWSRTGGWEAVPYADPPVLYKYRAFNDNGFRILRDRAIFFAAPPTLNDPLDLRVDLGEHLRHLLERQKDSTSRNRLARLYEYQVMELATQKPVSIHTSFNAILLKSGVYCLTATATEPLMWAHYSEGHKGFCIGFSGEYFAWLRHQSNTHGTLGAGPVQYRDSPGFSTYFYVAAAALERAATGVERSDWYRNYVQVMIPAVLSLKARAWRYEKEYRSVKSEAGPVPFQPTAIQEIVFGLAADPSRIAEVRGILAGKEWAHVRYRQAEFIPRQFEMRLRDM